MFAGPFLVVLLRSSKCSRLVQQAAGGQHRPNINLRRFCGAFRYRFLQSEESKW